MPLVSIWHLSCGSSRKKFFSDAKEFIWGIVCLRFIWGMRLNVFHLSLAWVSVTALSWNVVLVLVSLIVQKPGEHTHSLLRMHFGTCRLFSFTSMFGQVWLLMWCSAKESACQYRRHRKCRFSPWVKKVPRRRKWQPIPVSLPGESHGQRSLVGYSPWGLKRVLHDRVTEHAHMHLGDKIKYCSHTFDLIFVLRSYFTGSTWILHFLWGCLIMVAPLI